MDVATFMKTLTAEEVDTAIQIADELSEAVAEGLPEELVVAFTRAVFAARRVMADVRVQNLFEMALRLGLAYVQDEAVFARLLEGRPGDVPVCGIRNRSDSGIGAMPHNRTRPNAPAKTVRRAAVRGV